jgi:hypothetical protein
MSVAELQASGDEMFNCSSPTSETHSFMNDHTVWMGFRLSESVCFDIDVGSDTSSTHERPRLCPIAQVFHSQTRAQYRAEAARGTANKVGVNSSSEPRSRGESGDRGESDKSESDLQSREV